MKAQGAANNVNADAVGKLGSSSPVVFLGKAFARLVLTSQKPVSRIGRRAHKGVRHLYGHYRQHFCAMLHLLENALGLRHNKIFPPEDVYILQTRYQIGVHESSVKNGNGDALARKSVIMHAHTAYHFNLLARNAIVVLRHSVPAVKLGVVFHSRRNRADRIRRRPYFPYAFDKRQRQQLSDTLRLLAAHEQSVVPLAAAHHLNSVGTYG